MQTPFSTRIWLTGNIPLPNDPRHSVAAAANAVDAAAARRTLCAALTSAIDDATEVERLAEVVRTSVACATEEDDQSVFEAASAAKGCGLQATDIVEAPNLELPPPQDSWLRNSRTSEDVQVIDMAEATNLQLSPQQDTWTRDASGTEIEMGNELYANDRGLATGDALAEKVDKCQPRQSAVGTHIILELHDRLGSFIKR
jgi:hypothetical protein